MLPVFRRAFQSKMYSEISNSVRKTAANLEGFFSLSEISLQTAPTRQLLCDTADRPTAAVNNGMKQRLTQWPLQQHNVMLKKCSAVAF